jgi:GDP-D-mannose 3', 5'-epimerase
MYIDDCVEGLIRIMDSSFDQPVNLGTEEMVSINELVDTVCEVAGKKLVKIYDFSAPQGVRGRNSDNTLLRSVLGWEPRISLREGIGKTYPWIAQQVLKCS